MRENFIKFVKVIDLSGEVLRKTIIELLEQVGLSLTNLRGQSYNRAVKTSDKLINFKVYILKHPLTIPLTTYVHCQSHCLNLVMVKSCSIQPVRNVIKIVEEVTNFIRYSFKRLDIFKDKGKKHCLSLKPDILLRLCTTRWIGHHKVFIKFDQMFSAIILFL